MKVGFFTLGCKVNQYETEAMKEKFMASGHEIVTGFGLNDCMDSPKEESELKNVSSSSVHADVYIINTCTVTNMADRKSRQLIRRAKKLNPNSVIAVVGCYAQVDPDAVSKIDGVDIILGTNEKTNIIEIAEKKFTEKMFKSTCQLSAGEKNRGEGDGQDEEVREFEEGKIEKSIARKESHGKLIDVIERDELTEYRSDGIIHAMESRTRAYIKIQEGCDRFCTYCIIPIARGPVRSRDKDEIIKEAEELVKSGFREIVLTGINTALYGHDRHCQNRTADDELNKLPPLRKLIDKLAEIPGDFRIRLSSLEPNVVSPEDIMKIAGAKKLCHHLHLSIQSGSDNILKAMGRRYTREEYLGIVKALKDFDPAFGITTDMIVGFPGETEDDFEDSINLIKEAGLLRVHVFPYSKRRGTAAAEMTGQISSDIKKKRVKLLMESAEESGESFNRSCIGLSTVGLFEETEGDYIKGYSDNYIRIYAKKKEIPDALISVRITDIYKDGVMVEFN